MFKVKCTTRGPLAIQVGEGSVTLQPGKPFDLEKLCDRKWILADEAIQGLIQRKVIVIVFDSGVSLPKHNLTAPPRGITLPVMPVAIIPSVRKAAPVIEEAPLLLPEPSAPTVEYLYPEPSPEPVIPTVEDLAVPADADMTPLPEEPVKFTKNDLNSKTTKEIRDIAKGLRIETIAKSRDWMIKKILDKQG